MQYGEAKVGENIHAYFSIGRAFKFNAYFSKFNLNNVKNFFPSYYISSVEFGHSVVSDSL